MTTPTLVPDQISRDDKVSVFVNDKIFTGWESVEIGVSLGQGARAFNLGISGDVQESIFVESEATILIAGYQVARGVIDAVDDSANVNNHSITLTGRSRVGQIVDCSAIPTSFSNVTVRHIASRLSAPYGVEVVTEVDDVVIPSFRVQPGETVWAAIDRAARGSFLLVTDDEEGRLVLTRAGATGVDGNVRPLVFGQNILSRQVKLDWSRRFHTYTVHGQGKSLGDVFHRQTGTVTDDAVAAHRTLILVGGEQQPGVNASNRAAWEKKARLGEAIQYTATVQGWRDPAGDLWKPNTMVAVWDPYMRWSGIMLLVKSVTFSLSVSGATTTALTLCPRQAYEAPDETASRRTRGGIGRLVPFFAWPYNSESLAVRLAPAAQGWLGPSQTGDLE